VDGGSPPRRFLPPLEWRTIAPMIFGCRLGLDLEAQSIKEENR